MNRMAIQVWSSMSKKLRFAFRTLTTMVIAGAAASCSSAATSEAPASGAAGNAQAVFAGGCF